jgi:adenosylcobinamide kinase/adenosylcobinamide-phosphate guanylyltransferase
MKELILGGARSGKSARAEHLAEESGQQVFYIATATAGDGEMAERIAHHQARRPAAWQLVEEPVYLAQTLEKLAAPEHCLLVDCLTLWLNNTLFQCPEATSFAVQREQLLAVLPDLPGTILLVSNEVGMGVVPIGEETRRFVDEAGRLHQQLAQLCERVTLVVAGLPHRLKEEDK